MPQQAQPPPHWHMLKYLGRSCTAGGEVPHRVEHPVQGALQQVGARVRRRKGAGGSPPQEARQRGRQRPQAASLCHVLQQRHCNVVKETAAANAAVAITAVQ